LDVQQKERQNHIALGVDAKREIEATVVYRVCLTASVVTKINERILSCAIISVPVRRRDRIPPPLPF
jgi:hypothetical protein